MLRPTSEGIHPGLTKWCFESQDMTAVARNQDVVAENLLHPHADQTCLGIRFLSKASLKVPNVIK